MDDYADASIDNVFRPDGLLEEFNGKYDVDILTGLKADDSYC